MDISKKENIQICKKIIYTTLIVYNIKPSL